MAGRFACGVDALRAQEISMELSRRFYGWR
jgi:hypothetical protein